MFAFLLGIHLGVELLGHVITLFNLLRNCQTGSELSVTFYLLPITYEGSNFSTSLSTLTIIHF